MAKKYETTEALIKARLDRLITEVGKEIWTEDFQKSAEFNTPENRANTLGIILSKYCEWDGEEIKKVALYAFEDSNYHDAEIILDDEDGEENKIFDTFKHYLSNDGSEYDTVLENLKKALVENPNGLLDHVEEVNVWEKVQFQFSVKEFCKLAGITA